MNELPGVLARLWRVAPDRRVGRPPELDVGKVVSMAVDLADRNGLTGVSLPKLAEALGVTPMSLYRHIGSKDELLVLMDDHAYGPPPELDDADWRVALRQWTLAQRGLFRRRPWMLELPISGPPRGPHTVGWMDAGLRALRDTDLDWAAKVGAITVVSGYVRQAEQMTRQLEQGRGGMDQASAEQEWGGHLAALVDPVRYPEVAAMFRSDLFVSPPGDPDADFAYGLELVLDGVATAVESARRRG
jgi:AcrR family transcriptional regulator